MIPYIPLDIDPSITNVRLEILEQYRSLLTDLGGTQALDATQHSVQSIIDSTEYQTVWQKYWDKKGLITCARSCGVTKEFSNPRDQFINASQLQSV